MPTSAPPFVEDDDDPKVQAYRLRLVESDVKDIKKLVGEIHSRQITMQPCPQPGACLGLTTRVAALERLAEQGKGAAKLLHVLYLLFGAGIVAALDRLWHR